MRGKDDIAEELFIAWAKTRPPETMNTLAKDAYHAADALHRVREERREAAAAEHRLKYPDAPPRPKS